MNSSWLVGVTTQTDMHRYSQTVFDTLQVIPNGCTCRTFFGGDRLLIMWAVDQHDDLSHDMSVVMIEHVD